MICVGSENTGVAAGYSMSQSAWLMSWKSDDVDSVDSDCTASLGVSIAYLYLSLLCKQLLFWHDAYKGRLPGPNCFVPSYRAHHHNRSKVQ